MPSFMPFSVSGRHHYSLFDIRYVWISLPIRLPFGRAWQRWLTRYRLDNPFVVFRGSQHESSGQLIQGTLVLCLTSPLRIEDIRLRLTGTLRMRYAYCPPSWRCEDRLPARRLDHKLTAQHTGCLEPETG